jgi:hypothetical protein
MSFWDIVWFIFITWVFVAYLMALFSIIGDIFRDHELSGVWKAVWVISLVFFPFITAVVYLIARGGGMAERSMRASATHRQQQDAYIREVAGTSSSSSSASPTEQITQARALLDSGAISQPEYDVLKAKALGTSSDAPAVPRARSAGADEQVEAKS